MTISDEITKLNTNLTDSYTAVSNKGGTIPASENFDNLPGAINSITELKGETKTVTPTTSQQTITPSSGKNGITQVTVNAVTSAIDSNIQAQFIRNGVTILSVTGTYGEPLPLQQVTCSNNMTWYINKSGELYGCGYGSYGQQGNGGTSNVTTFAKRADNVKQIACSNNTIWYINKSGELYGCGQGSYGKQGSGDTNNVTTFTKRADNVKQIACSNNTTWYINKSGELYGCGYGTSGTQGNGSTSDVTTFTKRADNVVFVACSNYTTWYINKSGELYGCGSNSYGQQGNGTSGSGTNVTTFTKRADNVKQIACSENTTWYINESDELYGCGRNNYGQQGSGDTTNVTTFTKRADNVKQVACSGGSYIGMTWYINEGGELYGCGQGSYGKQGSGDTNNVTTFTKRADNVKQIACFENTTWYINESDELYGCGRNDYGQQGSGTSGSGANVLTLTKRADNVKQIACSDYTTWYYTQNDVYGCGRSNYGQQGSGDTSNVLTFTKRN